MSRKMIRTALRLVVAGAAIGLAATAQAGVLPVAGSPTYDQLMYTGLMSGEVLYAPGSGVNNSGMAVGWSEKLESSSGKGHRAVRWDASGTAATELGTLGADSGGYAYAEAYAVNGAGTAVGRSEKYVDYSGKGFRAVRWDASGTLATELGDLGTDSNDYTNAWAYAVNGVGTAVGRSQKYVSYSNKGYRAVRWDASGTLATELGALGTDSSDYTNAWAYAVNSVGTAVGRSEKYVGNIGIGCRAVRWDASGTLATELDNLGTDNDAYACAVNDAGTAVGHSGGTYLGYRAVRWNGSGTAATELGKLGTSSNGQTYADAYAVNGAGTAVGRSQKFLSDTHAYKGMRAVRWDGSGTAATELGNLGTDGSDVTNAEAYAVNGAGTAVGYSQKYVGGSNVGNRAVIWLPDASAIDLNDLGVAPVPAGGTWTLTTAKALSADGWVAGEGQFDPDGAGWQASYTRLWVAQVGLGGTWTNATGGTWGRGPNWSTDTPAMQVGNAAFDLDSAYTVALDRDELTETMAIDAGTVTIDFNGHTLTTESGLSIASDATLKGAGTIASDIINAGAIAPGNSPGTLDIVGDLTSTGTLEFEIAGQASYDRIDLTGSFNAGGTIAVELDGYAPTSGDSFHLMDFGDFFDDGYAFDFTYAGLSAGLMWDTGAFESTGSIDVVGVPEPGSFAMLAGIAATALLCWWRRNI